MKTPILRIIKLLVFFAFPVLALAAEANYDLTRFMEAGAEHNVAIYLGSGTEKELTIKVPRRFESRANQYIKAFAIKYMENWNLGVGLNSRTLPHLFDPKKFENTTPPRVIDGDIREAVRVFFISQFKVGETQRWGKPRGVSATPYEIVMAEGKAYREAMEYTGDDNVTEKHIKEKMGFRGMVFDQTIAIPPRFSGRSDEYAKGYALAYMQYWNKILDERDEKEDLGMEGLYSRYDYGNYMIMQPFVSGDIKNALEKLFKESDVYSQIAKDLDAHLKAKKKK